MPTLIITMDLECYRCRTKMQKILCCIQERGEFIIEKIVYEKDKIMVSGPFDADKLSSKLCCKAGSIIKKIEVAKPPPEKKDPPKEKKKPEPVPCKVIYPCPYPYPCPQPSWPCGCPTPYCGCQSKPPPQKDPKPPDTKPEQKPKTEPEPCKAICPYPYPYPCPQPAWPCNTPHCRCQQSKPPATPPPAPPPSEPPKPPACQCPTWSPCYCGGYTPYMPPPVPYPMVVCDERPPYDSCTVM